MEVKWKLGVCVCVPYARGGTPPVVLPFWHSGMEQVKPYGVAGLVAQVDSLFDIHEL